MRQKTDRNKELVRAHKKFPQLSYTQLGRDFGGISKQRVHQILNQKPPSQRQGRFRDLVDGFLNFILHIPFFINRLFTR